MAKDVTTYLDGIKSSIEAVGRSGRDEVYLDNVSFRVDASKLDIPHDSDLVKGREDVASLLTAFDVESYDLEDGNIFINESEVETDIVVIQTAPAEWTPNGPRIDMTVTISSSDVTNELPQTVLVSELFLHGIAEQLGVNPGRIFFNIAYAYVLWEDVEQIVEFEIEIPR